MVIYWFLYEYNESYLSTQKLLETKIAIQLPFQN